ERVICFITANDLMVHHVKCACSVKVSESLTRYTGTLLTVHTSDKLTRYAGTLLHVHTSEKLTRYTGTLLHVHTSDKLTRYAGTLLHVHTSDKLTRYTGTLLHVHTSDKLTRYTGTLLHVHTSDKLTRYTADKVHTSDKLTRFRSSATLALKLFPFARANSLLMNYLSDASSTTGHVGREALRLKFNRISLQLPQHSKKEGRLSCSHAPYWTFSTHGNNTFFKFTCGILPQNHLPSGRAFHTATPRSDRSLYAKPLCVPSVQSSTCVDVINLVVQARLVGRAFHTATPRSDRSLYASSTCVDKPLCVPSVQSSTCVDVINLVVQARLVGRAFHTATPRSDRSLYAFRASLYAVSISCIHSLQALPSVQSSTCVDFRAFSLLLALGLTLGPLSQIQHVINGRKLAYFSERTFVYNPERCITQLIGCRQTPFPAICFVASRPTLGGADAFAALRPVHISVLKEAADRDLAVVCTESRIPWPAFDSRANGGAVASATSPAL
ncbi:hypothetical protein L9F63_000923, partial [Diploptera punctata]